MALFTDDTIKQLQNAARSRASALAAATAAAAALTGTGEVAGYGSALANVHARRAELAEIVDELVNRSQNGDADPWTCDPLELWTALFPGLPSYWS